MTPRGRTRLFVDSRIQVSFIVYLIGSIFAAVAIAGAATFILVWNEVVRQGTGKNAGLDILYAGTLSRVVPALCALAFLLALLGALGMVVLSHRVAGPVYRIRRILKDLEEGKDPEVALRRGDVLLPLAADLKRLADRQRRVMEAALRVVERGRLTQVQDMSLRLSLQNLEDVIGSPSPARSNDETKNSG